MNISSIAQFDSEEISRIVEKIKQKYAPDKRTAIFDVNFSMDGNVANLSGETNLPTAKNELLEYFNNLKIRDNINMLPSKELGEKIFGVVNVSTANLRSKPAHSAELVSQVLLGSKLKVLKSYGEWLLVQCEDDYIGWMDDDGFQLMGEEEYEEWKRSEKIIVTHPFTFAYSLGNTNSNPVSDLVEGNLLKKISHEDGFIQVEFPDKRLAFIPIDHIQEYRIWLNTREQTFASINKSAQSLMGVPYIWGGTSLKGLDCSGFTKLVFQLNGVLLPRDASQQVQIGELIDTNRGFDNLKPGDLLFFGSMDSISRVEKTTHVAIYLGNLEFIHASGRVRINSFDKNKSNFSAGRLKSFIKAKRILSSLGKNGVKLIKDLD